MTYAIVRDVPASWDRYEALGAKLSSAVPRGLLLHVAGPTDEGFRTIDIWTSREDYESFRDGDPAEVSALAPATLRALDGVSLIRGTQPGSGREGA